MVLHKWLNLKLNFNVDLDMVIKNRSTPLILFFLLFKNVMADEIQELDAMTIYSGQDVTEEIANPTKMEIGFGREALQANPRQDLNNVIKSQPGVMLLQGSGETMSNISLRGAGGAGQGMFTLDGVPLFGNFAGFFSLGQYPIDTLENVTITKGMGGDKHGSRTLGGSLHLQTRRLKDAEHFLHLEGGSYDTLRETAGTGLATKVGDFSMVVGRSDVFTGISQARTGTERDGFDMTHASGNWFKNFDRGSLDASLYLVDTHEDYDGPGVLANKKIGWIDDKKGLVSSETIISQLHGEYDVATHWNSALQLGFTQNRQEMVTTLIKPFALTSQLLMVDWKNTHRFELDNKNQQAIVTWGINTQHQRTMNFPTVHQTVISPNVRGELFLGKWQLKADARFDQGDVYGNHSVFSLGVNRELGSNLNLWANGGTGYRQPGVSELMNPVYGNKNLKGESNAGGEMGLTLRLNVDNEIKVSGYYQHYQNMITLQLNSATGSIKSGNVTEADVWGAEIQGQHRWTTQWKTGLSYGYMDATNSATRLKVALRPEHQGIFWNELQLWQPLKFRLELNVHDGYWFDTSNQSRANFAARLNSLLNYEVTPKTDVYVRVENINNERTAEITPDFNFNGTAFYFGVRSRF